MFIFIYSIFKIYLYRMYIVCTYGHLGKEIKASETTSALDQTDEPGKEGSLFFSVALCASKN